WRQGIEVWCGAASPARRPRSRRLGGGGFPPPRPRHDLVTQQERARARFDVRVGDPVTFTFEGAPHVGVVNRITRRATVLVECADGEAYTDGRRYRKFYVPLAQLRKVAEDGE